MRSLKFFRTFIGSMLVVLSMFSLHSCSEEMLALEGSDCSIISLNLKSSDEVLQAEIFSNSIKVVADLKQDLTAVTAEVKLSEGATMTPDPTTIKDWSNEMSFVVTAADGTSTKEYTYSVTREALSEETFCDQDIYLTTQKEVDEFGAKGYLKVRSIIVNDNDSDVKDQITDLSALNTILSVEKSFLIKGFHGKEVKLEGLQSVAALDIAASSIESVIADHLTDINNLFIGYLNEHTVGGERMDSLANLSFASLKHIKGNLVMAFNNRNPEFAVMGFENLENVDEEIIFNFPTKNFKTFSKLTKINSMQIGSRIQSMEGLENIKEVTGTFSTNFLMGVESLLPFAPEKVNSIMLMNCQQFNNLDFCKNLTRVENFQIRGAYRLHDLKGLENLKEIGNTLKINYTRLNNLNELANLEKVGEKIQIEYNSMLEDFSGLKKCLQEFDGEWVVRGNKKNPKIKDILAD